VRPLGAGEWADGWIIEERGKVDQAIIVIEKAFGEFVIDEVIANALNLFAEFKVVWVAPFYGLFDRKLCICGIADDLSDCGRSGPIALVFGRLCGRGNFFDYLGHILGIEDCEWLVRTKDVRILVDHFRCSGVEGATGDELATAIERF